MKRKVNQNLEILYRWKNPKVSPFRATACQHEGKASRNPSQSPKTLEKRYTCDHDKSVHNSKVSKHSRGRQIETRHTAFRNDWKKRDTIYQYTQENLQKKTLCLPTQRHRTSIKKCKRSNDLASAFEEFKTRCTRTQFLNDHTVHS